MAVPDTMKDDAHKQDNPVPRAAARIDDWFVERFTLREKIGKLLDTAPPEGVATAAQLRELRQKIRRLGRESLPTLVDVYITDTGERSMAAFMVLSDYPERQLQPVLTDALSAPNVSREAKLKLLALSAFESDRDFDTQHAYELVGAQPGELVEAFTSAIGEMLEPEEIGLMWMQDFWELGCEEKVALISFFISQASAQFLPALEIEMFSPHVDVRRTIAHGLRHFEYAESLELAERMMADRNPTVRYDAQQSHTLLRSKEPLAPHLPPSAFEKCYCLADADNGTLSVLYAARGRRARIKFCCLLVDTWNRGIVDAWGNVGILPEQFEELVRDFSHEAAGFGLAGKGTFESVTREHGLYLINEAIKMSRRRRTRLPAEFYVWQRLFRSEKYQFSPSASPVKFGLVCSCCASKILANRRRTNLFADRDFALCRRCLDRVRKCRACGRTFRLADVHDWNIATAYLQNACEACIGGTRGSVEGKQ